MLMEINSEVLVEKSIKFNSGLNVVLGDNKASNSIGKSTMLMIIDFIFGGDSYITNNHDVIEHIGHHEFKFAFNFSGEKMFFIRSTDRYKRVACCNELYYVITEISLEDYKELIKRKYNLDLPFITFREIVSLYSRIWGKDNYDINKPLQFSYEGSQKAIERLIKLYNKFSSIKSLNDQINELSERKKVLNSATKKSFIPSVNRSQYKEAEEQIKEITSDIAGIKTNCESIISKEVLELKHQKSELIEKKNKYNDRLINIKINLSTKNLTVKNQLVRLVEFFPNINIDKLETIDNFHTGISSILKDSLKITQKELESEIANIDLQIRELDKKIEEKLESKDVPKYTVDRLLELVSKKSEYEKMKEFYEKKQQIDGELSSAKKDFKLIKEDILTNIKSQINVKMYDENKKIHTDGRRAPDLQISEKSYMFTDFNDTGAGKAFASLITLDMAIFMTTKLPFLIHDTMIFKNIENNVLENIISIYNEQEKQIFISIDEMTKFNEETQKILLNKKVIQLSYDRTLFNSNWKLESN